MNTKPQKYTKSDTRGTILREAFRQLDQAGVPDSRQSAEWLLCEALGCSRLDLLSRPDAEVAHEAQARLHQMLDRRANREPVQYIVGYTEFMGYRIAVDPNVLVPRPETESLVERVVGIVESRHGQSVLDIGTGSGCIAIAVDKRSPGSSITACDVSAGALHVARMNGRDLGCAIEFVLADALAPSFPKQFPTKFDVIVSNPPYVPRSEFDSIMPEVREHEPHQALFVAGDPLLFYRAIVDHAPELLIDQGWMLFEVHQDYAAQVEHLMIENRFKQTAIHKDLAGRDRIVEGRFEWRP